MKNLDLTFNTSQEAWEGINEYILLNEGLLKSRGQGRDGGISVSYDNLIYIRKAWVDPEFDFGKIFAYKSQKWSHLVNNYVDLNYLDILKQEVLSKERKKQRQYNLVKHFTNKAVNGKDCLISLTFCRRITSDIPILIFYTRASEVTKRLLIDFLLVQRIGEYVYGKKQAFSILFNCPMAYLNIETFCTYHSHKNIADLLTTGKELEPFQKAICKCLEKFLKDDPFKITYTSHRRIALQFKAIAKNKYHSMKAKDLELEAKKIDYPEDIITEPQRSKYRKSLNNNR